MSAIPMKPMDVFSAYMDIPFDVAAYARGHKFAVEVVKLNQAIQKRQQADDLITKAENLKEIRMAEYNDALATLRGKMTRDPL